MIYVLMAKIKKDAVFKVGFSLKPERRISDVQTNCPFKLSLVALRAGTLKDEKAFHRQLAKFKTNGEWFRDTPEVRAVLDIPEAQLVSHKESPLGAVFSFMWTNKNYSFDSKLICDVFKLDYFRLHNLYHQHREASPIRLECVYKEDLSRINFAGPEPKDGFLTVISHSDLFNPQLGGYERFHSYYSRITPFNKHLVPKKWLEPKYPGTYFHRPCEN